MNNIIFASVISEIQQSPMFMTVKAVICDTPEANLNGAKVTEKFVNEVVKNAKRYVGLPLYADVKALTNGSYNRLGHLYDVKTGEFHSTQIGSFYKFEKEEFERGYHLIGYARIPKRNKKLSNAIGELFAQGRLKFSFEVSVGEYEENDDGTITIDASENNYLEGTAIVTYPACEDAVALELVAQKQDVQEGDEQGMEKKNMVAETTEVQLETAEEKTEEVAESKEETVETKETAEETKEQEKEEAASEEDAACKKEKEQAETAEVYVRETVTEAKEIHAYDTDSGKSVHQEIVVTTSTEDAIEGSLVQSEDGTHIAETEVAEADGDGGGEGGGGNTETPADPPTENPENPVTPANPPAEPPVEEVPETSGNEEETIVTDNSDTKRTAEQMFAELAEVVENLRQEIAALKETKVVVAQTVTAEVNPMVADINTQKKYGLLEKAEKGTISYSLLEKY